MYGLRGGVQNYGWNTGLAALHVVAIASRQLCSLWVLNMKC